MAKKDAKKEKKDKEEVYGVLNKPSADEQKKITDYFCKEIASSLEARKNKESDWVAYKDYYEDIRPNKTSPWQDCANVPLPLSSEMVDGVNERCYAKFTSSPDRVNVNGLDDYSADKEQEVTDFVNAKFKEINMDEYFNKLMFNSSLYHVGYMYVGFERLEKRVRKYATKSFLNKAKDFMKGEGWTKESVIGETEVTKKPVIDVVDIEDVVVSTNELDNEDKAKYISVFYYPTLEELKEKKDMYFNIDELENKEQEDQSELKQQRNDNQDLKKELPKALKVARVLTRWDLGGGKCECILEIEYNTKTLIRAVELPYFHGEKPLTRFSIYPDGNKWFGYSLFSRLMVLNKECETVNNMMLDNFNLCINKIFTVLKGCGFDATKSKVGPGMNLSVNSHDDIRVLEMGDFKFSAIQLIKMMQQFAAARAGLGLTGSMDMGDPRASGKKTQLLMSSTDMRVDVFFKRINDAFVRVIKQIISMYAQYGDNEIVYHKWDDVSKSYIEKKLDRDILIDGKFGYILNGLAYTSSVEAEKQNEMFLYDMLSKSPLYSQPPAALGQLSESQLEGIISITKNVLQKYGKKNIERYIPTLESLKMSIRDAVAAEIEQKLKQAAMMSMAQPKVPSVDAMQEQGGGMPPASPDMGGGQ